jgi:GxxExxY protein
LALRGIRGALFSQFASSASQIPALPRRFCHANAIDVGSAHLQDWHGWCLRHGCGRGVFGERLNEITERIIGSSIQIHRATGPGLLESVYLACLVFELGQLGFKLQTQSPIPVVYKRVKLDCGFRADLIVEDAVIVEIKAVDRIAPIHQAQMLTYLRLSGCALGLIINFNTKLLTDGVKRVVNGFPDPAGDMRPRRTESTQNPRRTQRT